MQKTEASLHSLQFSPLSDILYKQSQIVLSILEHFSSNRHIGHSLLRNMFLVAIAPKDKTVT